MIRNETHLTSRPDAGNVFSLLRGTKNDSWIEACRHTVTRRMTRSVDG